MNLLSDFYFSEKISLYSSALQGKHLGIGGLSMYCSYVKFCDLNLCDILIYRTSKKAYVFKKTIGLCGSYGQNNLDKCHMEIWL